MVCVPPLSRHAPQFGSHWSEITNVELYLFFLKFLFHFIFLGKNAQMCQTCLLKHYYTSKEDIESNLN